MGFAGATGFLYSGPFILQQVQDERKATRHKENRAIRSLALPFLTAAGKSRRTRRYFPLILNSLKDERAATKEIG